MFSSFFSGLAKAIITWSIEEVMSFLVRSKWAQPKPKLKEIPYTSGINHEYQRYVSPWGGKTIEGDF